MVPLFDAHFHVIDPRFPLVPAGGYLPASFTVDDYRAHAQPLGVVGGAVVSGSFQGFDQTYLVEAMRCLGPGFVGVTQLPADVSAEEVRRLDAAGVRAVRVNVRRGLSGPLADLDRLARRVHDVAGWHVELYADAASLDVAELARLPQLVLDHLGLSAAGLPRVLELVAAGAKVKASGFGRVDPALDVADALARIAAVDPSALLFGTDLPSTRARRPFRDADLELLQAVLDPDAARMATWDNAVRLYQPPGSGVVGART